MLSGCNSIFINTSSAKHERNNFVDHGCSHQTPPSYGFGRYGFGFCGPRIAFRATGALWGRATPFFYHFSVHLSSVLGRTELCHEVWTPGPQKPQIISNENHHLALFDPTSFSESFKPNQIQQWPDLIIPKKGADSHLARKPVYKPHV